MRGKWLLAGGTVILAAIAAGALSLLLRHAPGGPAPDNGSAPAPPAEITLPGKVRAQHVVPVAATAEGTIEVFLAEVGQEVYEGELLARIKNATLESAREQAQLEGERARDKVNNLDGALIAARLEASRAEADAARARAEFERARKLFERQQMLYREGATPRLVFEKTQKESDNAQAEHTSLVEAARVSGDRVSRLAKDLEGARSALAEREQELEDAKEALLATEVHSPVDGIVVARRGAPGEEINRSVEDLFQIAVDLGALEVALEPEPPVLARLRPGQPALVFVAEAAAQGLPGAVKQVNDGVAVVEFTSPDPAVKPGLTAQARITIR